VTWCCVVVLAVLGRAMVVGGGGRRLCMAATVGHAGDTGTLGRRGERWWWWWWWTKVMVEEERLWLSTLHIPRIPFWRNSIWVIPGTIPAEFVFRSKFRRNFLSIWQVPLPNLIPPEFQELPGFCRIPAGISGGQ
jgi:hypothetical protein